MDAPHHHAPAPISGSGTLRALAAAVALLLLTALAVLPVAAADPLPPVPQLPPAVLLPPPPTGWVDAQGCLHVPGVEIGPCLPFALVARLIEDALHSTNIPLGHSNGGCIPLGTIEVKTELCATESETASTIMACVLFEPGNFGVGAKVDTVDGTAVWFPFIGLGLTPTGGSGGSGFGTEYVSTGSC